MAVMHHAAPHTREADAGDADIIGRLRAARFRDMHQLPGGIILR